MSFLWKRLQEAAKSLSPVVIPAQAGIPSSTHMPAIYFLMSECLTNRFRPSPG